MKLPPENERVKKLIDYFCNGNELQFSKEIGISQPRINRLFTEDKRNGKFPEVSSEIFIAIINKFVNVSAQWLLTGVEPMLKNDKPHLAPVGPLQGVPLLPFDAFAGIGDEMVKGVNFDTIEERYVVPLFDGLKVDFMMSVRGSSMYPKYSSGDVVACRLVQELLFVQWNKVYVIDTKSQGIIMKRLLKSPDTEKIICRSDNKDYGDFEVPTEDIRNIALVVGVIRLE